MGLRLSSVSFAPSKPPFPAPLILQTLPYLVMSLRRLCPYLCSIFLMKSRSVNFAIFAKRVRTRTVSGNKRASKHTLKQVELFCAGVSISSRYKRNAAWYNLSCLYGYRLTTIWAPTKNRQLVDCFRRHNLWRNQLWPSGWKKDDVNRCLKFFFADHGENCLVCPTSLSRS